MREEGLDKRAAGRDAFLERAWTWKESTHGRITQQLRRLGCSLDWSREAFTMDAARNRAVTRAFVDLQAKGLIYRDLYLVNWCPHCLTAISDDEVDYREINGHMWHIRYPLADDEGHVTVATTRPETLFGDTAVAVNPDDPDRRGLIGRRVRLPLTDREIPIIGDHHADPEKGTGTVKITPAHDPNDFQVGRRHGLPQVICMDERAVMNEAAGRFAGLDRFACRKAAVEALTAAGLLDKVVPNVHQVGHHDRCGTIIEPYLSRQWFLRMQELAGPAIQAVEDGTVKLYPERWVGVYHNWMRNIRDWCISRQLWWGHRIPVWYCECGETIVSRGHTRALSGLRVGAARAGSRRPGHLVLELAVDLLAPGLARAHGGPRAIPSQPGAGHRGGHHLLLGRAHDHGELRVPERTAVHRGPVPWHRARQPRAAR